MRAASLLVALATASLVACGSSNATSPSSPESDSGSVVQAEAGVPTDAAAPVDASQDSAHDSAPEASPDSAPDAPGDASYGPYPAAHYPMPVMKNFGGPVMTSPKVYTVTFGTDSQAAAKLAFDDAIVTSPWWTAVTAGYGVGPGTSGGAIVLPDTVSNKTLDNDADLIPLIQQLVASGALPTPDGNSLYAMYFPQSTTITLLGGQSCNGFGGYHDAAPVTLEAGVVWSAFAVLPDCGSGLDTVTTSHEFIEAATDPHPFTTMTPPTPFTYYMYDDAWTYGPGGGEVGDLCEGRPPTTQGSDQVTTVWNNLAAMASHDPCVPQAASEIFYSAAVPTQVVTNLTDPTGGPSYEADGFIVMPRGTSKDIDVVVFSEAPLPHDLALIQGARVRGSSNVAQLNPIGAGITSSLSAAAGHNGTHVTLSIQVASTAAPADYPFVVRAILDPATPDYHSWPVVLRVTN